MSTKSCGMIKFRMVRISVEQFAILASEPPALHTNINLETQLEFKEAKKNQQIACNVIFKFRSQETPFLILNVMCAFEVAPNDWEQMTQEDKCITLPKGFLCHIAVHTIGTARGILYMKTEGTPFNKFILPAINIEEMVKEDLVIENHPCD